MSSKLPILFLLALPFFAAPSIRYNLSFPNAIHHEADVRVVFSGLGNAPLEIVMSRSSPGRYALHEFAKNIFNFRAIDSDGRALQVRRDTPSSWSVTPRDGEVVCTYTLFGDRVDGTYAAIDATHAHLNMPAVLIWARGLENASVTVHFDVPPSSKWKPATQLIPNADGSFTVADVPGMSKLEWLMDSPVELSAETTREWKLDGSTFRIALHGQASEAEADAFAGMCKAVVAEEKRVFGEFPNYENGTYTFLIDLLPWAHSDGMEHRDSTVISAPLDLNDSAKHVLAIASHEFFHSWNVKRMRPRSLEPFDFERANMSGELWFAEGFTNYYGDLILKRVNLCSLDEFLNHMGQAVNAVLEMPGSKIRSAVGMSEQASFVDAATSIDPTDQANTFISYYTYGEALAFGLDLAIRARYPGKSLDDWMRTLWREHPDVDHPYTLADLEHALAEAVWDANFAHEIFLNNIEGLQPLDYAQLMAPAGLSIGLAHPGKVWLGAENAVASESGVAVNNTTLFGSPLYNAGIDSGDEIQACDGDALKTLAKLGSCLASHRPGDTLKLRIKGRTGVRDVAVILAQDPTLTITPFESSGRPLSRAAERFRYQWLSGSH